VGREDIGRVDALDGRGARVGDVVFKRLGAGDCAAIRTDAVATGCVGGRGSCAFVYGGETSSFSWIGRGPGNEAVADEAA